MKIGFKKMIGIVVVIALIFTTVSSMAFAKRSSNPYVKLLCDTNCNLGIGHIALQIRTTAGNTYYFSVDGVERGDLGKWHNLLQFVGSAQITLDSSTSIDSRYNCTYKLSNQMINPDKVYTAAKALKKKGAIYYTKNSNCASYVYDVLKKGGLPYDETVYGNSNHPVNLFYYLTVLNEEFE